jgi:DNA-binding transcriptional ArsR family regulator
VLEQRAPSPVAVSHLVAALGAPRLSLRIRRLLRDGHAADGLSSASEGRMTVAVAVRGAGLPQSYLATVLDDPANVLTMSYRDRPLRWRRRELERLWSKAGRWLDDHPLPTDAAGDRRRMAATWRAALGSAAWPGVGGASALAVAEALGALAVRVGRPQVGVALDDVAVGAGLSRDAARGALRRLVAAGWLTVAADATATQARTYQLVLPGALTAAQVAAAAASGDADLLAGDSFADLGADVARWSGGLGKSATRVARALAAGPVVVCELAGRLNMSANAVRIHLRRLRELGVAVRDERRCWQRTAVDANTLAEVLGVRGTGRRQAAVVAQRRAERSALRSAWIAARAAARRRSASSPPADGPAADGLAADRAAGERAGAGAAEAWGCDGPVGSVDRSGARPGADPAWPPYRR